MNDEGAARNEHEPACWPGLLGRPVSVPFAGQQPERGRGADGPGRLPGDGPALPPDALVVGAEPLPLSSPAAASESVSSGPLAAFSASAVSLDWPASASASSAAAPSFASMAPISLSSPSAASDPAPHSAPPPSFPSASSPARADASSTIPASAVSAPSSPSSAPSATPPSSSPSPYSPPPGVHSGASPLHPPLSSLERWALQASDSQFNALSGAIGGFTSGIVTCPLDVIKTKLQAQGGFTGPAGQPTQRRYKGLVGTARTIWHDEGLRGMYRGLGPIILGYLPTWAVWFTVYNKSKVWMADRGHNNIVVSFWSSLVAGASSTIVTNPIWVIKTRLMSQMPSHGRPGFSVHPKGANTPTSRPTLHTPWHYRSTMDAARKMYTTEGILSFYSGLTPALLGLTHVAVQFPAYEYLKTRFTGRGMGDSAPDGGEEPSHWMGVLSATILSKALASGLTYPHEVIRTRLQTQRRPVAAGVSRFSRFMGADAATVADAVAMAASGAGVAPAGPGARSAQAAAPEQPRYRGVVMTFRTILREEGWRAFYAGLGTNMMRAVPAATVTMLTYEYAMQTLKRTRREAQLKLHDI